ncbi:class I adenylate-forming enzyme family protein [Streptomyces sp. DSM 44915]|uniref:Class I adenylate-forming enzyme family protein n=1 Tax=Streptomyces chisholmiae TaxID=3075540 RepID=A0ABU2JNH1_9ACTN|nr:class I adenylate-forming enzyme family protein [Streptomyces sp. DSM 44915]MDT0266545.1 class I adenylate-forming enzyme family protein [Streptomyces sp. DSM 44915]
MGTLFDDCASRGGATLVRLDRPFDLPGTGATTYDLAQLAALVEETAGWLAAAGVRARHRVAIVKDNHWDYDLLACAAVRLGAVPAQLSAHLAAEPLGTLLDRLRPRLLVTTAALLARHRAAGVDPARLAARTVLLDGTAQGATSVDELRGARAPGPRRRCPDEPLVINHTSGTTGVPKLVVHSTRTIIHKLARFEAFRYPRIGVRRDDTVVNASSYAHGRTFCWTASVFCLAPKEIAVLTGTDPEAADLFLRAHPPTVLEALPSVYGRLAPLTRRLDQPFHRVRLFVSTYDAVHPPTLRAFLGATRRRGAVWMQGWGQTETGPLTFRFHTRRALRRADAAAAAGDPGHDGTPGGASDRGGAAGGGAAGGTWWSGGGQDARDLGRPVPFKTRLRVVDPVTFAPLPPGRAGLLLARTAARAPTYLGERERWLAKDRDGWWNTGDIGVRDRSGTIRLLDREVDHTPGTSCLQLEDLLEDRLPWLRECVVLTPPGQEPVPVLVTDDGAFDRADYKRAVADLPPLAEPVVRAEDSIPRTGTGKVRRHALLEQLTGRRDTAGSGRWT